MAGVNNKTERHKTSLFNFNFLSTTNTETMSSRNKDTYAESQLLKYFQNIDRYLGCITVDLFLVGATKQGTVITI